MATEQELFQFIDGANGEGSSPYDLWLALGNVGTAQDFLNYLKTGKNGASPYDLWLELHERDTSIEEYLEYLRGEGKSVIDSLDSDSADNPLSARQGKILKNNRVVSLEELDLVTEEGFFLDALVAKDLKENLNGKLQFNTFHGVDNGLLENAYMVDVSNHYGDFNKPRHMSVMQTTGCPSDFSEGLRFVDYYNPNLIVLTLKGADNKGNNGIWTNMYNGTSWLGWKRVGYSDINYSDIVQASVINAEALFCKTGNVKSFTIGGVVNQVLAPNHQYGLFNVPDDFKPSMIITEHHITGSGKIINLSFAEDGVVYITPFSQVDANDLIRLHIVYI